MGGNVVAPRRLMDALIREGVAVTDNRDESNYDLLDVHTPIPFTNILEVRRAKKRGIPVVMHAHTTAEDAKGTWTGSSALSGIIGRYLTFFYNKGDVVVAPSCWTKGTLEARHVKTRIEVVSNGIDLERFRFDPERRKKFRARYGIPEDAKVVYAVGVVCIKKGVEALPLVARELPDLQFVWIGRRSRLYHPIQINKVISQCPPNVRFLHDVEDVLDAHCGCDLFFTPSYVENQGLALMEAMAVGRPVVARNLKVYENLLVNGENAFTCGTTDEFTESLRRLSGNTGLASAFARGGKAALNDHEMSRVAKNLLTVYSSLLEPQGKKKPTRNHGSRMPHGSPLSADSSAAQISHVRN